MATKSISRNAPCPCGSGKKYKQCCIDKATEPGAKRSLAVPTIIAIAGLAGGAYTAVEVSIGTGIAVAAGGLIAAAAVIVFSKPPPPSGGGGNPAGLDFGRK